MLFYDERLGHVDQHQEIWGSRFHVELAERGDGRRREPRLRTKHRIRKLLGTRVILGVVRGAWNLEQKIVDYWTVSLEQRDGPVLLECHHCNMRAPIDKLHPILPSARTHK